MNNVPGSGTFFGVVSTSSAITSVTLSDGDFFGVDNVAFSSVSPSAVPEPSTLVLAGAGLVSFVLLKWRRRPQSLKGQCGGFSRPAPRDGRGPPAEGARQ